MRTAASLSRLNAPRRPTSVVHQGREENAKYNNNSLTAARTQKKSRLTRAFPSTVRSFGDVEVVVGRPFGAVDGCVVAFLSGLLVCLETEN